MVEDKIQIPFSLSINPAMETEFNLQKRLQFWNTVVRAWLQGQGYTMYEIDPDEEMLFWTWSWPSEMGDVPDEGGPYALYDKVPGASVLLELGEYPPPYAVNVMGRVCYAQDQHLRHVALKLVECDSNEIKVLQRIFEKQRLYPDNVLPGVVPILDLMQFGGHWLAVMPRWGVVSMCPWFKSVREVVMYIRSLLEGLASLHSHRIVHEDLAERNVLINHFPFSATFDTSMRPDLRRKCRAKYAIFDFDLSRIIPPDRDRLSYKECPISTYEVHQRDDLQSGQYDYDPFACDVALLGLFLSRTFDHLTPVLPILAPLFDGMLTWQIEKRLTARQALHFFDDLISELSASQLECILPPRNFSTNSIDRWAGLPEDFLKRWAAVRAPPLPWQMKLLRFVCKNGVGALVIRLIRRTIDTIMGRLRS